MTQWKVKDGTQVNYDGKVHGAGDTFSATEAQVRAAGVNLYVEEVKERKAAPKADDKKDDADAKAQQSSANKATQPESNKAQASSKDK